MVTLANFKSLYLMKVPSACNLMHVDSLATLSHLQKFALYSFTGKLWAEKTELFVLVAYVGAQIEQVRDALDIYVMRFSVFFDSQQIYQVQRQVFDLPRMGSVVARPPHGSRI